MYLYQINKHLLNTNYSIHYSDRRAPLSTVGDWGGHRDLPDQPFVEAYRRQHPGGSVWLVSGLVGCLVAPDSEDRNQFSERHVHPGMTTSLGSHNTLASFHRLCSFYLSETADNRRDTTPFVHARATCV